jgi:hypothetical protein
MGGVGFISNLYSFCPYFGWLVVSFHAFEKGWHDGIQLFVGAFERKLSFFYFYFLLVCIYRVDGMLGHLTKKEEDRFSCLFPFVPPSHFFLFSH